MNSGQKIGEVIDIFISIFKFMVILCIFLFASVAISFYFNMRNQTIESKTPIVPEIRVENSDTIYIYKK
jgi:hypothetical protein